MPDDAPKHIAIIPDGNRRWAKAKGLRPEQGHQEGFDNFDRMIEEIVRAGVPYTNFLAASEDNLVKRSPLEVKFLVAILRNALTSEQFEEKLHQHEIKLNFVGRWDEILHDGALARSVHDLEERTAGYQKFHLTILFGYDGRREMIEAIHDLQKETGEATQEALAGALWTGSLPPVDLVIRTGEEEASWSHWSSGFMMWLTAESQFYFTQTFWPAFGKEEFDRVLETYAKRERRFGK
jgi:undecaprenyl diphosphate synthase